jgi:glycosyltransferase involved in cell wall biosynthesis
MLLYVPYDVSVPRSGSTVRPNKMREAFEALGCNVLFVSGRIRQRVGQVLRFMLSGKRPDFCYAEPSTQPLEPIFDYPMFLWLALLRVPTAVFSRDGFWKLADWHAERRAGWHNPIWRLRYERDSLLYRLACRYVVFPTLAMGRHFRFKRIAGVAPGCDLSVDVAPRHSNRFIYVGAVNEICGTDLMLAAFAQLNQDGHSAHLTVICREPESPMLQPYLDEPWLEVRTAWGDELRAAYATAATGIVPWRPYLHQALTLPIKLFEYFSFGLPAIVTNCSEMATVVRDGRCGIVADASAESLANAVGDIARDGRLWDELRANVIEFRSENTWEDRARAIACLLAPSAVEPASEPVPRPGSRSLSEGHDQLT